MSDRRPLHAIQMDVGSDRRSNFLEPGRVMLQAPDLTIISRKANVEEPGPNSRTVLNERRAMPRGKPSVFRMIERPGILFHASR